MRSGVLGTGTVNGSFGLSVAIPISRSAPQRSGPRASTCQMSETATSW
jgi:hypothetical protein